MKQTIGSSSIERGFLRLRQRALISLRTKMKSATSFSYLKVKHSYLAWTNFWLSRLNVIKILNRFFHFWQQDGCTQDSQILLQVPFQLWKTYNSDYPTLFMKKIVGDALSGCGLLYLRFFWWLDNIWRRLSYSSKNDSILFTGLQQKLFCQCWVTGSLWSLIEFYARRSVVNAYLPLCECLYLSSHYL